MRAGIGRVTHIEVEDGVWEADPSLDGALQERLRPADARPADKVLSRQAAVNGVLKRGLERKVERVVLNQERVPCAALVVECPPS